MLVTTTWNTTRPRMTNLVARLVPPRPPSLSTAATLARDAIQAGRRPETIAAANIAIRLKPSTGPSMSNVIHDGGGKSKLRTVVFSRSVQ